MVEISRKLFTRFTSSPLTGEDKGEGEVRVNTPCFHIKIATAQSAAFPKLRFLLSIILCLPRLVAGGITLLRIAPSILPRPWHPPRSWYLPTPGHRQYRAAAG